MRLVEARIDGFGRLSGTVEFGESMTVIAGPNEAGKTTLVECILRILFGYPEAQPNKYRERYRPWDAARPHRASLKYSLDDGTQIETWRDFSRDDVPTQTTRSDVQRPMPEHSGNRKVAPAENITGLSLDAFQAAAVIRASEFSAATNGGTYQVLAERLAEIVGSAGKQSAAAATERLTQFVREIGGRPNATRSRLTQAIEETKRAQVALDDYVREFAELAGVVDLRAQNQSEVAAAQQRLAQLQRAAAYARLAHIDRQLEAVGEAERIVVAAQAERERIETPSATLLERADAIESAAEDWAFARKAEQDAHAQALSQEDKRRHTQARIDACIGSRKSAEERARRLSDERAALGEYDAGMAEISSETVAQIEAQADHVDVLEARARGAATDAAVGRHKQRPSPLGAVFIAILSSLITAAGLFVHQRMLLYSGLGGCVAGLLLLAAWMHAAREQRGFQHTRERFAEEADALFLEAKAALDARCRQFGSEGVSAVRAAREAQIRLTALQSELATAQQEAIHHCEQEATLQRLFDELQGFESRYRDARQATQRRAGTLTGLLNEAGIVSGGLDERLAAFRRLRSAGEDAANADAKVANARADLNDKLAGCTTDSLLDERKSLDARMRELAPPQARAEAAGSDAAGLQDEVESVKRNLVAASNRIEHCNGQLQRFDQRFPAGSAALEERLMASKAEEERLARAKAAAEAALRTIEEVKDKVHGNFVPLLKDAVSRSMREITGGRYSEAFIDPSNFAVRVSLPETGNPAEAAELSSGTREQLFLALRAATAKALGSGERVPLLLDDALAHSDDVRLNATLAHLFQAAQSGQQVVLFTQRDSVVEAAQRLDGVRIVMLSGPN